METAHIILHDNQTKQWLQFDNASNIIEAYSLDDVVPALEKASRFVEEQELWSVGFVSYEAGPAFDTAMTAHPGGNLPLVWFGLFKEPNIRDSPPPAVSHPLSWKPNQRQTSYRRAIHNIKNHIAHGNTYQVNYTLRMHAAFEGQAVDLFAMMANGQQCEFSAFIKTDRFAICSASPELFFDLQGERLTSRPMKGTAPRGLTSEIDNANAHWLHTSEKNRAENLMIVDMVRNDMGRIARIGTVEVSDLYKIEKYPSVLQMTSTVQCDTDASIPAIFKALFPCASITGSPKIRTMEIITELEESPRGVYTGAIGFWAPNLRAQFNVAIRTAVVDLQSGEAEYGTGSGIIWDSDADDEYAECLIKTRVLSASCKRDFDLLESLHWSPDDGYFLLNRHIERLRTSADYFNYSFDESALSTQLLYEQRSWDATPKKARLLLRADGELIIEAETINNSKPLIIPPTNGTNEPIKGALAQSAVDPENVFLHHKTTNRTVYEDALASRPGIAQVLLWNTAGELTEFTTSNLVARIEDKLVTPPGSGGLLRGTLREELLARGEIQERTIKIEELGMLTEIWAINSVRGWQRIRIDSSQSTEANQDAVLSLHAG